jgi:hypothetical protein
MKKLILISSLFVISSCKKETPQPPIQTECVCEIRIFTLNNLGFWSWTDSTPTPETDCNLHMQGIDTMSNELGTWRTMYVCQ